MGLAVWGGLHGGGRACRKSRAQTGLGDMPMVGCVKSDTKPSQPLGFLLFQRGVGVASREEETEKKQNAWETVHIRPQTGQIFTHPFTEPGSGEHPQLGTPGFMLVSGLDVRPEPASV